MKDIPCSACKALIRVLDLRIAEDAGKHYICACGKQTGPDKLRSVLDQIDAKRLAQGIDFDKGEDCPCCKQFAKRYRRKLNAGMARWLIRLYYIQASTGAAWVHTSEIIKGLDGALSGTDATAILPFWDLIEAQPVTTGVKRGSGFWRVTDKGRDFVLRNAKVEEHAVIYNNVCERLEGKLIDIVEALGEKFDYAELMSG